MVRNANTDWGYGRSSSRSVSVLIWVVVAICVSLFLFSGFYRCVQSDRMMDGYVEYLEQNGLPDTQESFHAYKVSVCEGVGE